MKALNCFLILFISISLPQSLFPQKYVKKDITWYAEENGKLYCVNMNVLSVKFKVGIKSEAIETFLQKHGLRIRNVNDLGIYDVKVATPQDIFDLQIKLKQSDLVEFAQINTFGDYIANENPPSEMILHGRFLKKKNDKWHLETNGYLYEVIPNLLSLKFKKESTDEQCNSFLSSNQLHVIRKNSLGIYDVRTPSPKTALDFFDELYDHELLEFVELNTIGVF